MDYLNFINLYGLFFAVILLVPDIIYQKTHTIDKNVFDNRAMLYIERIGKYGSLFLMGFNLGVLEDGFTKPLMKDFWLVSVTVMTVICVALWILCFKKLSKPVAYTLTVITSVIFMLSGLLQVKTLLLTAGIIYLAGQLYVTNKFFK